MRTTHTIRRALAGAAVVPLLAAGVSFAVAGPASAATCTHPAWSDRDKSGYGTGNSSSTAVHTGPNSGCGVTASVGTNVRLYYHCYVVNSAGNTWTNVRIDGTNIVGWVWDSNLDDNGSVYHC